MADDTKRIDIGFKGGQVLPTRVADADFQGLKQALESGSGWHSLKTVDSEVSLYLAEVVYVRVDTEDQRVGF
jgi:hypothetical protein